MNMLSGRGIGSQFVRFALVGALGFLVDVAVLYLALHGLSFGVYEGRLASYLCAATFTWQLNRRLTFIDSETSSPARQWVRFILTNGLGGIVNYGTYGIVVSALPANAFAPLLGVALGSLAGLGFNFVASRRFVFKTVQGDKDFSKNIPK